MAKNYSKKKAFTPAKYSFAVRRRRNLAGFTLVEILIALVIFSIVMVLSAGIFSSVIGSQSSLNVNSDVSKESQRVMSQISNDIVNATGVGSAGTDRPKVAGILLVKPAGVVFGEVDLKNCIGADTIAAPDTACRASAIVLFSKDRIKIYRLNGKQIEYAESNSTALSMSGTSASVKYSDYRFAPVLSPKVEVSSLIFRGLACYTAACNNMPFVQTEMEIRTASYDTKAPGQRAKLHLRTQTTGRSY